MIKFLKKHIILSIFVSLTFILDIFVIVLALIPSNKDITTPGGLNEVKTVISVDTNTELAGSFNTIYVYSIERSSVLHTFIAGLADYNDISDSSQVFHLSDEERIKAGQVQKNQSIEASLICAYNYANKTNPTINLEYSFEGFIVRNYQINNSIFKIGDIITSIYDNEKGILTDYTNPEDFRDVLNYELSIGDSIKFIRDGIENEVVVDKEFDYYNNQNMFYCYAKYKINEKNASPSYTIYKSNTLGPSGGLMQTLSIYCQITGIDLSKGLKIVGTGTISVSGNVGEIGGIEQKIATAIFNNADVFLCPSDNWKAGYQAYLDTPGHQKMKIFKVSTFEEALYYLEGLDV